MAERLHLKGITWDHSRGYDPLVATSAAWMRDHPDVTITWDKRSLQAFADRSIDEMEEYDLIVFDHPHVGEAARSGLLLALDEGSRDAELALLAEQSVGASHHSYRFDGRQWGLAIDAATPVAAYRPDRIRSAPGKWSEVVSLARKGEVGFALIPINALMTFMGLARNMGMEVANGDALIDREEGRYVLELMLEIAGLMHPRCLELDPIGIYEWMGRNADGPSYSPFGYGYTNYSRDGFCRFPLAFADAPGIDQNGPGGTVLGGAGIAVTASCSSKREATDYAFWIAGSECQGGLYFDSGGQPGNAVAWDSWHCNARTRKFFSNTRKTLETAWLRPRYDGYMGFQDKGGECVHSCLVGNAGIDRTIEVLQEHYEESRK